MIKFEKNNNGPVLGYNDETGLKLIEKDGLKFKDLARTGTLLPYEDWRLSPEKRAEDLTSRLTPNQLIGFSFLGRGLSGQDLSLTKENIDALSADPYYSMGRFEISDMFMNSIEKCVDHVNREQAVCEAMPYGIPMMYSIEGMGHLGGGGAMGFGGCFSDWPSVLGVGATFDPKYAAALADAESKEYRSVGMTMALTPQIDIATEPRWSRFNQTFGEGSKLTTDMARAYVDALQTSTGDSEISGGWGYESVAGTAKHFPGGGTGEGGRDAHYAQGKYAVYPGGNFDEHLKAFTEGAFKLDGPTKEVACLMPYYTISYGADTKYGEDVGNSYSKYITTDLLRGKYNYTGMVTTDFEIMRDTGHGPGAQFREKSPFGGGRCWGYENYSTEARFLKTKEAGVDQYGGGDDYEGLLAGYELGKARYGEDYMNAMLRKSVERILVLTFKLGLFENPYVSLEKANATMRSQLLMKAGREAQEKSLVLLKNHGGLLPIKGRKTVYIPKRHRPDEGMVLNLAMAFMQRGQQEADYDPLNLDLVKKYYDVTDDPSKADFAIVCMSSPSGGDGFNGKEYLPISLQYRPYTALTAREVSLAGGHITEDFTNRSYRGKSVTTKNECDLDIMLKTKAAMGNKPVVALLTCDKPCVVSEFEYEADAIVACFGAIDEVLLDLVSGAFEPSGLLPMQLPANMETVEAQFEDVPFDMDCHKDADGNVYDYAYGLNWSGKINDWRVEKYGRQAY